jgi:23S rRNA pseudouridine1911/1915/1917 synthase
MRLDRFLRERYPGVRAPEIHAALREGRIRRNGRPAAKGDTLRGGDTLEVDGLRETSDWRIAPDSSIPLDVLRESPHWAACAKPAGMPTHPLRPDEKGTLANAMVARWPEIATFGEPPLMGGVLHRLDTDTSGIVLAARDPGSYAALRGQFAERTVVKTYLALVAGVVETSGRLENDLVHAAARPCRMTDAARIRTKERPMRAVTEYRPLSRHGGFTLLEVVIRTGVTHQIRCQLSLAGHPLAGDALYGGPVHPGLSRHFLHAVKVAFSDPATGRPVTIEAPLPPELQAVCAKR